MDVIETRRLVIRPMSSDDAGFICTVLNDEAFLRYIGDRGVRTEDDARRYIATGPTAMYARHGLGLCLVTLKDTRVPIGICGVLKREALPEPDLGFAFLPAFRLQGYASESASATLQHARDVLGLTRLLAITAPDNARSIALLTKLGFRFDRLARLDESGPELKVFQLDL
jgi:RimJ/RimL family protein N-acetyltransferase